MNTPEIALLISTYERPNNLARVLASIATQEGVDGTFEVVVSDDGSKDQTADIVADFARTVDFPVRFTSRPHDGFQLARCRNDGVRASIAAYLVFLDGDCVIPPDHLAQHRKHRRPHTVFAGFCCWMDRPTSERITIDDIRSGQFMSWAPHKDRVTLRRMHWKACYYNFIRHASKPKLFGGNIGIWRRDYELVNGYDENFRGWGCEDDDFRLRLRQAGIHVRSILRWTQTYHLWHPPAPSVPSVWREGANVGFLKQSHRSTRSLHGLEMGELIMT